MSEPDIERYMMEGQDRLIAALRGEDQEPCELTEEEKKIVV